MAGEWPLVTVGELADSISDTHVLRKDHLIFLNTSDILLGKILHHSYSAVRDWPGQAKKSIRRDDVLFSEIRPANGRWAYVDVDAEDYVVSTKLMVIRGRKNRVVPRFLYHFLTSSETTRWLQHLAESRSGTFPQITFDQVAALELALPPLGAQATIADFLNCITNKIDLNWRMNETLEAMAQAIFKSWFVDFDPVRAKVEGRDPGLPKAIAEIFPDRFEDSELGEIPEGWTMRPLYETASFINGAAFRTENFCDSGDGLPVIKIAELKDGVSSQTKYSRRSADDGQLIDTGDLLYSWSGSPDTSLDTFLWTYGPGLLNQHIFKVVTSSVAQKRFVYYLLKFLRPVLVEIARNKQTTGLGHVTVADMKRLCVCWPSPSVLFVFDKQVAPFFDRAFSKTLESRTLTVLLDSLLPKLISGELRVKDGAHIVLEATV